MHPILVLSCAVKAASSSPFIDLCQGDSNLYLRFKGREYIPISNLILQLAEFFWSKALSVFVRQPDRSGKIQRYGDTGSCSDSTFVVGPNAEGWKESVEK